MDEKIKNSEANSSQNRKIRMLWMGIIFDLIGMVSFSVPGIGEFSDIIWAPIAGVLMTNMYKGKVGKIAGIVAFLEELTPFTDIIPSFTLTWLYVYYFAKEK